MSTPSIGSYWNMQASFPQRMRTSNQWKIQNNFIVHIFHFWNSIWWRSTRYFRRGSSAPVIKRAYLSQISTDLSGSSYFPLLPIILLFHSLLQQKITPYILGSSVYIEKNCVVVPYSCIINLCSYDYPTLEEESMVLQSSLYFRCSTVCGKDFMVVGGEKPKFLKRQKKNLPTTRDPRPTCIPFMFFGCLLAGRYLENF